MALSPRSSSTRKHDDADATNTPASAPEPGPMARRLEEATEEALFTGGRAGRRAIEDAGFNEELKNRLLNKIADAKFQDDHEEVLREAGLVGNVPEAAGQGTRDMASAQPWTGQESQSDAVLRMLEDARKPLAPGLRGKPRTPSLSSIPVDMRLKKQASVSAGRKAANAKEAASVYTGLGMKEKGRGLSDEEREAMKKELRDRFTPAARALPNTIAGLAALANERIEDAIARGQFKDIPRGKGVERDARSDNPFIDTTEYIMNKMIKKQDIVPPWIEKQQEVVKTANVFRARLRNDWRRHAARMIASHGGSLEEQMRRAEEYGRAEEVHNPRRRNSDQVAVPTNSTDDVVMVAMRQEALPEPPEPPAAAGADNPPAGTVEPQVTLVRPFRDKSWESTERSYMELAIDNLNKLTRAYNLMAPELAKKPYFNLDRELKACFADVAPQLANEIKERARRPEKSLLNQGGHEAGSLLDRFARESRSSKVYDSKAPHYGFKEMWRDLWQ
ncbi:hypothetical protein M406DRAFT_345930 [Cryphonectria parasitica EP155]|uniref:DnaJ homologue subfamily C member 28 conserved domain-containing protein n=1 Tax=Cryphonectria parasitica (strain ATCC 38755 / EP155) TaxID=660469 RepID=A0A9P4Y3A4_CRYP1|nr:uncharacterized protein M406DRAFT_345930 [Cryphonectria parasitica EP155]KAF3765582.1 hypothetical protein M406DRAFT_345930 [Cryphonectria parasitica EP155]